MKYITTVIMGGILLTLSSCQMSDSMQGNAMTNKSLSAEMKPAAVKTAMKAVADWQIYHPARQNISDWRCDGKLWCWRIFAGRQ